MASGRLVPEAWGGMVPQKQKWITEMNLDFYKGKKNISYRAHGFQRLMDVQGAY